jgi:glycosyltransferase involved in cell wall biosynthesis
VVGDKAVSFQKSDVAALAETLQKLADEPALVASYKATARDFICEKYDWNTVTNKTMELYHENSVDQQVPVS